VLIRVSTIGNEHPQARLFPFHHHWSNGDYRQNDRDKMNLLFHG